MLSAWPLEMVAKLEAEKVEYKVIHLIRHAQGQHNAAVAATGSEEEYKNWAWQDSRLTELGKTQAAAVRPKLEGVPIDIVFVSPLSRTIQTGQLAIPAGPKFIVDDRIRERNGTHPCDKRRSVTELKADFPFVDFSSLTTEEDNSWTEEREPWGELVARAEAFVAFLAERPERNIAVVTHNDWLQALLLGDSKLGVKSEALRHKFGNAEHMAFVLTVSAAEPPAVVPKAAPTTNLSTISIAPVESRNDIMVGGPARRATAGMSA